jgi:cell division septal protein FtsQ
VTADEVRELAGVEPADQLLAVDADAVARQLASHPWIASARVRRELPSVLAIEISERHAVASALLGALYLLDANGRLGRGIGTSLLRDLLDWAHEDSRVKKIELRGPVHESACDSSLQKVWFRRAGALPQPGRASGRNLR